MRKATLYFLCVLLLSGCQTSSSISLFGKSCEGIYLIPERDTVKYFTRWDRAQDGYLKASGAMQLTQTECKTNRNSIKLDIAANMDFFLSRLGRINPNDKAKYLFLYEIAIFDDQNRLIQQEYYTATAQFPPRVSKISENTIISQEITLKTNIKDSKSYSAYIGFIAPSEKQHWNLKPHPPQDKLISKPI